MPLPFDYSRQLNEIVTALNRPSTPSWVIAIIGAATGVAGSLGVQLLLRWYDTWSKRRDMSHVICRDLVEKFWAVHLIETCPVEQHGTDQNHRDWQERQLKALIKFTAEDHASGNPDVYMQIQERAAAEMLYRQLHQLVTELNLLSSNLSFFKSVFAKHIQEGYLPVRSIRRAVGRKGAKTLLEVVAPIYQRDQDIVKAAMARQSEEA